MEQCRLKRVITKLFPSVQKNITSESPAKRKNIWKRRLKNCASANLSSQKKRPTIVAKPRHSRKKRWTMPRKTSSPAILMILHSATKRLRRWIQKLRTGRDSDRYYL